MRTPIESDEELDISEQDADDNVINCTIPPDRSLISMIGINTFADEERFESDGWVYNAEGTRLRKWFINFQGDYRLWEPKLKDIAAMETKRYKVRIRCNKRLRRLWREFIDSLPESAKESKTPIFGKRFVQKENKLYWMSVNYDPENKSLGFDWVRQDENNPEGLPQAPFFLINQDVVDGYWRYEYDSRTTSSRSWLFHEAFIRAVSDKFYKDGTYEKLRLGKYQAVKLIVNDREYWFASGRSSYGMMDIQCISTPEQTLVIKF